VSKKDEVLNNITASAKVVENLTDDEVIERFGFKKRNLPMSDIPDCPKCGDRMRRTYDTFGEYFTCFRFDSCNERIAGKSYGKYYTKAFNKKPVIGYWRHKAHKMFDYSWQRYGMTRPASYIALQKIMRKTKEEAHISKFTVDECKHLTEQLDSLGDAITVLGGE